MGDGVPPIPGRFHLRLEDCSLIFIFSYLTVPPDFIFLILYIPRNGRGIVPFLQDLPSSLTRTYLPLEGDPRVSLTGCRSGGGAFLCLSFSLVTGTPGGFPWPLSSSNGSVGITLHLLDLLLGVSSCLMVSHLYSSVFWCPRAHGGIRHPCQTVSWFIFMVHF